MPTIPTGLDIYIIYCIIILLSFRVFTTYKIVRAYRLT